MFGKPAIVMAINRYAKVVAATRKDNVIRIISEDLHLMGVFGGPSSTTSESEASQLKPLHLAVERTLSFIGERVGIDLTVSSDIPIAVGLGSSASVAVATVAAVGKLLNASLSKGEIRSLAHESERLVHGKPSGIDDTIATYGGIILFRKNEEPIPLTSPPMALVVANSDVTRSTKIIINRVLTLRRKFPKVVDGIIESIGEISIKAMEAIVKNDLKTVGLLMNVNHELLSALEMSNDVLDQLVRTAISAGAFGAKLTGAGGGGCIIALVKEGGEDEIVKAMEKRNYSAFPVRRDDEGVRAWLERG